MKKICILLLTLVLVLSACSGGREKPEAAVSSALNAVKAYDLETAQKYFADDGMDTFYEDVNDESEAMAKLIFSKFNFETGEVKADGDSAVVETKITNVDMSNVFRDYVSGVFTIAFSGVSQEEMTQKAEDLMAELLDNKDNDVVTNTVNVSLNYEEGGWHIEMNEELMNAMLGNLLTVTKDLNGAADSGTEE